MWHALEKQGTSTSAQLEQGQPPVQSPDSSARATGEDRVFGGSFLSLFDVHST